MKLCHTIHLLLNPNQNPQSPNPLLQTHKMTKLSTLRRRLFPCLSPSATPDAGEAAATKSRLSTSLREDPNDKKDVQDSNDKSSPISSSSRNSAFGTAKPRPSKTMVIGTIFGGRRAHAWFCVQHDRLSASPLLLVEFPFSMLQLVAEMGRGDLVRVALECARADIGPCALRAVPAWTVTVNGQKAAGFASRRPAGDRVLSFLRTVQSTTSGAGVIPAGAAEAEEDTVYMRGHYEHVVGNADAESFHLINQNHQFSVFLLRSVSDLGASRR